MPQEYYVAVSHTMRLTHNGRLTHTMAVSHTMARGLGRFGWCRRGASGRSARCFIDNLLVRIHFIIVMIRWTGLAPFPFPGSLTSTFLSGADGAGGVHQAASPDAPAPRRGHPGNRTLIPGSGYLHPIPETHPDAAIQVFFTFVTGP